jgi:hypothetical protein
MRVKDEEAYIERSLESMRGLDCPVILLDDGSTDKTPEIAQAYDYVRYHRQDFERMDEARDRAYIFQRAWELQPEWVLTVDGDEMLPKRTPWAITEHIKNIEDCYNIIHLAIAFIWHDEWYVDFDTGPFWHHRLYRCTEARGEGKFSSMKIHGAPPFGHGLHCGPVPQLESPWCVSKCPAYLKAYGYDTREGYEKHFGFYQQYDPSLWSQNEIIQRLNHTLVRWDDSLIPAERTREQQLMYLIEKMESGLRAWERVSNEPRESKTAAKKPAKRPKTVGRKRQPKGGKPKLRSSPRS